AGRCRAWLSVRSPDATGVSLFLLSAHPLYIPPLLFVCFFPLSRGIRVPLVHVVFLFGVQCFPPFKANQNQLEQEDPVAPLKEAASLSLSLSLPPSLTIPLSLFLSLLLSPECRCCQLKRGVPSLESAVGKIIKGLARVF